MIRRVLAGPGVFFIVPVALLAVIAAAWFAGTGLIVGLIHAPALGVLAAAAAFTAHYGTHPDRTPQLIRKVTR